MAAGSKKDKRKAKKLKASSTIRKRVTKIGKLTFGTGHYFPYHTHLPITTTHLLTYSQSHSKYDTQF